MDDIYDEGYKEGYEKGLDSRSAEIEGLEARISELETRDEKLVDAIQALWNMV